jgi:rod shape-determining protein MreD
MIDPVGARIWSHRALFVGLVALLALLRLLPIDPRVFGLPGPDVIVVLAFAWVLRRPSYVPPWLLVSVFLPLDLLLQRPPGLGALAVLLGAEALRRRAASGGLSFLLEWGLVAGVLFAMTAFQQVVLALTAVPAPPLGLDLLHALFSALIYPLAVWVSAWAFGIRRASPGEVDALGARL